MALKARARSARKARKRPRLRWWERIPAGWQLAIWLALFLLLSRLLYVPWSHFLAASDDKVFGADANTSLVLEGVGRADETVLTIRLDDFRNVTVKSPRAHLAPDGRALLESIGQAPPDGARPGRLEWSVELPPEAQGASLLTIGLAPAPGADLAIGTRSGTLEIRSNADLVVTPVAQEYPGEAIGGALTIGAFATTAAADLVLPVRAAAGSQLARVNIGFAAKPPAFLLGDPFQEHEDVVPVRSLAWLDEAGRLVRRLCGAPDGRVMLWSALFQPRLEPQPPAEACRVGHLNASQLTLKDDRVEVHVSGSGFASGLSDWLEKLKGNIVLWPLVAALIAIPGKKLWAVVAGLLARSPDAAKT